MLWIGAALTLAVGIVTLLVVLRKHTSEELGSVSPRWIAEHRVDAV